MPPIGGNFSRHVKPAPRCARSWCSAVHRSHDRPWRDGHQRCVGCETQGRPGGTERPNLRYERWGNRRRRSRRVGAAAAFERAEAPRVLHGIVRSTAAEALAEVSALVRARLPGAVRGEAGTGDARSATATSRGEARSRRSRPGRAKRVPRRARREAPWRGGHGGDVGGAVERGHDRVGPAHGGERSEPPGKRSAQ